MPEPEEPCSVGCYGCGEEYVLVTDPNFSEEGMIPMNFKNYWNYADSTWDEFGNLIDSVEFLITPLEANRLGADVWWKFDYPVGTIHQSNDTIYDAQQGLFCAFKYPLFYPFDEDSIINRYNYVRRYSG
ncbi:MAG: hypothetical protein HRT89_19645 [Lentisphaeria bacterium]|nr:hypothetical protein [Lentisphaeria bacterium]